MEVGDLLYYSFVPCFTLVFTLTASIHHNPMTSAVRGAVSTVTVTPLSQEMHLSLTLLLQLAKILRRFRFNNQPDALIIQISLCYKTLHVSGIFFAHHQEFSTIHSALVNFIQVLMTASKQSQDVCLEAVIKNLHET